MNKEIQIEKLVTAVGLVHQYTKDLVGEKNLPALRCVDCGIAVQPDLNYQHCPYCGDKLISGVAPAYLDDQPWYSLVTDLLGGDFVVANRKNRVRLVGEWVDMILQECKQPVIDNVVDCEFVDEENAPSDDITDEELTGW